MTYTPLFSNFPHLQVPENRVKYAFDWYCKNIDHPNNFACYSYWIERCEEEGSSY